MMQLDLGIVAPAIAPVPESNRCAIEGCTAPAVAVAVSAGPFHSEMRTPVCARCARTKAGTHPLYAYRLDPLGVDRRPPSPEVQRLHEAIGAMFESLATGGEP